MYVYEEFLSRVNIPLCFPQGLFLEIDVANELHELMLQGDNFSIAIERE